MERNHARILRWSAVCWLIGVGVCVALVSPARGDDASTEKSADANDVGESFLNTLREAGIEPNEKGIRAWLVDLRPNTDHETRARQAVALLGSDDWRKREQATKTLFSLPAVPGDLLEKAAQSTDPEVAARAKEVLSRRGEGISPILRSAFRVIKVRRYDTCLQPVIDVLPFCRKQYVRRSAADALSAIARPGDLDSLRRAFESAETDVRAVLIQPLAVALGSDRSEKLTRYMNRGTADVRLQAAVAMLNLQNRSGLKGLVSLLDANSPMVRSKAVSTLRAVTGQYLKFNPTGSAEDRSKGVEKWSNWVAANGQTAKLRLPARVSWGCRADLGGNYLLAYGYKAKVEEIDPTGKVVWSHKVSGAWSAEKLPDGTVLIAAYSENKVIVVNQKSERIWEFGTNCLNAELLPNGNFLVADYSQSRAIEISREKKIVWTYKTSGSCADAERLPNGNTLVAGGSSVQEVTREGKVVWEHNFGTQVYSVQHLPNGNVLASLLSHNRIEEINRDKQVVWKHNVTSPSDAFRLPNGNTLVTGNNVAYEITPEGKKLWSREGLSYGTLRK